VTLLVGLLLWPDLGELGALGFSLKRRLEEAVEKSDANTDRVRELAEVVNTQQVRIDTAMLAASTSSARSSVEMVMVGGQELRHIEQNLPTKAEAFRSGRTPERSRAEPARTAEEAVLGRRLIEAWEEINRILFPQRSYKGQVRSSKDYYEEDVRASFARNFEEELQIIRAARNAYAHAFPLAEEELRQAASLAEQILRILRDRLS
jgi:hypothetical protein